MGCTNRPGHPGNFIQGSYTPNSKKELEEYKKLHYNRYHARIITPDGLCFICEAHKNISEAIGRYIGNIGVLDVTISSNLILDEVLSVGDGAFKKKSEAKMKEISSEFQFG